MWWSNYVLVIKIRRLEIWSLLIFVTKAKIMKNIMIITWQLKKNRVL